MISKIATAKWQSRIDLSRAYFQVRLTPESQPLTAFQTDIGTFSYLRMPMGLCSSAATCQRLMDIVLRGAHKYSGTIIDDTTVLSKTFEEYLIHLRDVFDRLRYAGLTVNTRKCHVATKKASHFRLCCRQRTNLCRSEQSTSNFGLATPRNKEDITKIELFALQIIFIRS